MSDVLDDVNARWTTFSSLERNQIAQAIAGKNQMEIFLALMENYDKALVLEQEALNSTGSAMERYGVYQESLAAKQAELTAAFEGFAYSGSTQELVKSFYELGIAGVKLLDSLSPIIEVLGRMTSAIFKAVGGAAELAGAILSLDVDYFKDLFGGDTEKKISLTEEKIKSIEEQIELISGSDIDIDVKTNELERLREELQKANDEIERLNGENREDGYSQNFQSKFVNPEGEYDTFDVELNIDNVITALENYEFALSKANKELDTADKKNIAYITTLTKQKKAAEENIKAIKEVILAMGKQIRTAMDNGESLTENESAVIKLIYSNEELRDSFESLISVEDEESGVAKDNAIAHDDAANAKSGDKDETNDLASALDDLREEEARVNAIVEVVNRALQEQAEKGQISASTALDLIEVHGDFQDALVLTNGKLVLNSEYLMKQAEQAIKTGSANVSAAKATSNAWSQATKDAMAAFDAIHQYNEDYYVPNKKPSISDQIEWDDNNLGGGITVRPSKPSVGNSSSIFDAIMNQLHNNAIGSIGKWPSSGSGSSNSSSSSNRDELDKWREEEDKLKDKQDLFKTYLDYILKQLDKEKEALEKEKDKWNEYYDEQLKGLEEVEEAMDEEARKEEYLLNIQEKRNELAKAQQQVVRVFESGKGFVYRQDFEAIAAAQDELNMALKEYDEYQQKLELDKKKQEIEDARDKVIGDLDDEIDKLDELADAWKDSLDITEDTNKYEDLLDDLKDFEDANYKDRLDMLEEFKKKYKELLDELNKLAESKPSGGGSSGGSSGGGSGGSSGVIVIRPSGDDGGRVPTVTPDSPNYIGPSGGSSGGSSGIKNPNTGGGHDDYQDYLDDKYGNINSDDDYYDYVGSSKPSGGSSSSKPSKPSGSSSSSKPSKPSKPSGGSSSSNKPSTRPGTVEDLWYSASGRKFVGSNHLSMVGEEGPELRVLHQGDGVVPADMTENLMDWGRFRPSDIFDAIQSFDSVDMGGSISNYNMSFDSIVLPDVTDFESFKTALMNESRNFAIQIQSERN